MPDALGVPRRVEDSFRQRSGNLPAETQLLLLVAAADPTGDVELLWRAAAHLGITREAVAPAETAGLVEIDTRVRFRHPLVRSAAERAARELRATGEIARKRTTQPTDALTAQELHIARLVATGATNREVGAQLFLSPRTIEAHLRSIFHKLDITSRLQIKDLQLP